MQLHLPSLWASHMSMCNGWQLICNICQRGNKWYRVTRLGSLVWYLASQQKSMPKGAVFSFLQGDRSGPFPLDTLPDADAKVQANTVPEQPQHIHKNMLSSAKLFKAVKGALSASTGDCSCRAVPALHLSTLPCAALMIQLQSCLQQSKVLSISCDYRCPVKVSHKHARLVSLHASFAIKSSGDPTMGEESRKLPWACLMSAMMSARLPAK